MGAYERKTGEEDYVLDLGIPIDLKMEDLPINENCDEIANSEKLHKCWKKHYPKTYVKFLAR